MSGVRRKLTCALILHQAGFVYRDMGFRVVDGGERISNMERRRKTSA